MSAFYVAQRFRIAYLDFCKSGYNECLSFLFLVNHLLLDKNGGKL